MSRAKPIDYQGKYYKSAGVLQMTGRYHGQARAVLFQAGISAQSPENLAPSTQTYSSRRSQTST